MVKIKIIKSSNNDQPVEDNNFTESSSDNEQIENDEVSASLSSNEESSSLSNNDEEICKEEPKRKRKRKKPLYEDSFILERIVYELNEIKKEMNLLRQEIKEINNKPLPILIDVRRESMDVEQKIVKAALKLSDDSGENILGDIMLFKKYYLKNNLKPIKPVNMRHYEYWSNGKWNYDQFGKDIMDIISENLKLCYIKANTAANFEVDQFILNQRHIFKLSDHKYKI